MGHLGPEVPETSIEREARHRRYRFNAWTFFILALVFLFGTMGVVIGTLHSRVMRLEQAAHIDHGTHGVTEPTTFGPAPGSEAAAKRERACGHDEKCRTVFDAAYYFAKTGIKVGSYAEQSAALELGSSSWRWVESSVPMVTIIGVGDGKTTRITFGFAGGPQHAYLCENWRAER